MEISDISPFVAEILKDLSQFNLVGDIDFDLAIGPSRVKFSVEANPNVPINP